ncbi:MAG: hypothetical protein AB8I08_37700 [Sandaracinaceae bacterium]
MFAETTIPRCSWRRPSLVRHWVMRATVLVRFLGATGVLIWVAFVVAPDVAAQDCAAAAEPWGEPWPTSVSVPSSVVGDPAVRLTREDGERLRCLLQRRLRQPVTDLPLALRPQVQDRRVGPLWMDHGQPRIGAFWVQSTPDGPIHLSETLSMNARSRVGLSVRFERVRGAWRLSQIHTRFDRAR